MRSLWERKRWLLVALCLVILVVLVIVYMQIDTNSVMTEVRSAFLCPDAYVWDQQYKPEERPELYAIPGVKYVVYYDGDARSDLYSRYNTTIFTLGHEGATIDVTIRRVFAWHNFQRGILRFKYTLVIKDKEGQVLIGGYGVPVTLTIQKNNGKWDVTNIDEAP